MSTVTSLEEAMFACSSNKRSFLQRGEVFHCLFRLSSQGGGGSSWDLTYNHLKIKMLVVSNSAQLPGARVASESQNESNSCV